MVEGAASLMDNNAYIKYLNCLSRKKDYGIITWEKFAWLAFKLQCWYEVGKTRR
jgi:hypothetical protein